MKGDKDEEKIQKIENIWNGRREIACKFDTEREKREGTHGKSSKERKRQTGTEKETLGNATKRSVTYLDK